jgi:class 3 adenylate cyclase
MVEPPSGIVALLFTDIEGSTQLLSLLGDRYAGVLADHHRILRDAFAAHDGYEVDTQGDAFFVAFARGTDAVAAAAAAQRALARHTWPEGGTVRVRMGLHMGQPLLTDERYIGLDVHRAARIAAAAHGGQVLLSHAAAELVRDHLDARVGLRSLGAYALTDFERPEQLFSLLIEGLPDQFDELRAVRPATDTAPTGWATRLVGRAKETERLKEKLASALAGRGSLVLLAGEAGIGKTRLVEVLAGEAGRRGVQVLWGRCWESDGAPPFWPWVEILRGVVRGREPLILRAELGSGAPFIAELVPELHEQLVGLQPAPPLEGSEARFRLFDSVTALLQNAARAQPLLLVLDDLHWADMPSLLLLQFLAQRIDGSRVFVVGTYRDMEVDHQNPLAAVLTSLRRERAFEMMALTGLSAVGVEELVQSFLNESDEVGERSLAQAIWRQTEGNPLFVQEELRYLIEQGRMPAVIDRRAGAVITELGLPPRVQDVIRRRLARLSDATNALLAVAAVIGPEFDAATLEQSSAVSEQTLDDALDEAETARVIEPVPPAVARYRFSHALFREVLYVELPSRRRTRLHQQVAQALERAHAQDLDAHLENLAYHFLQALPTGTAEKALAYSERAAGRALASYAYEEAARHLEAALQALAELGPDSSAKRCDLLLLLGEALVPGGEPLRVVETVAPEALELALGLADHGRASRACQLALTALGGHGAQPVVGTGEYSRWLELADRYAPSRSLDRVRTDLALSLREYYGNHQRTAFELAQRALFLARELNDDEAIYRAATRIVNMRLPECQEERLRLAEELTGRPQGKVSMVTYGAFVGVSCLAFLAWGDRARAEEVRQAQRQIAARTRNPQQLLEQPATDLILMAMEGRLEDAAQAGKQFRQYAKELGVPGLGEFSAFNYSLRALCYLGRVEEALAAQPAAARAAVAEGRSLVFAADSALCLAFLKRWREVRRLLDPLEESLRTSNNGFEFSYAPLTNYLEAAVLAEDREMSALICPCLAPAAMLINEVFPTVIARHLGAACALLGKREKARAYYQEALGVAGKVHFRPEIALTRLAIAELPLENDDQAHHAEALEHLDFAIAEFRDMKMQPALERALRHKEVLKA